MAKGNTIQLAFETYQDDETGVNVCRLTPKEVLCHRNYFYQKCFTTDGSQLLFAGAFDGNWNYYLLNLKNEQARQLTEGAGDNTFGGFLSPDDKSLYYVKSDKYLMKVDIATLEETLVYTVPDDWVGYGTWVANSDCTKLVGIEISKNDWVPLNNWEVFHKFYELKPRCRLIKIEIESGSMEVILEENRWLGHPIYRPFDDSTIAFCHEGPHDLVDARMWLIDEDGTNMRKVKVHEPDESCTHEFWVPNGSALVYVSFKKGQEERAIYRFSPENNINERIMSMPACSHLMSNFDGSLLVGDGSGTPIDVKDTNSHEIKNDPFIYVFDVLSKKAIKVAKHSTSWNVIENSRQVSHPHPSFTPDSKAVLFGSDKEGNPAIYLASIPEK